MEGVAGLSVFKSDASLYGPIGSDNGVYPAAITAAGAARSRAWVIEWVQGMALFHPLETTRLASGDGPLATGGR